MYGVKTIIMDGRIKKHLIALVLLLGSAQSIAAQPLWLDVAVAGNNVGDTSLQAKSLNVNPHVNSRRVSVDYNNLKSILARANTVPTDLAQKSLTNAQIDLPMPYGGLQTFNVYPSLVMAAELAVKFPQIKTYKIISVEDPTVSGTLDVGNKGFHAYLFDSGGEVFIDPVSASTQQEYYSYYKRDYASITPRVFSCGVSSILDTENLVTESKITVPKILARTSTDDFISYRIAVATTGEYSQAVKNPGSITSTQIAADALAEVITVISRINEIFGRDLAIRFELVTDNNLVVYTDPLDDLYTDPTNASLLIDENQAVLDDVLGTSAYDIGHVFSADGGGLAVLGAACLDSYKAQGESGHPNPVGDPFYIDIVAHELGHQLGANHSFNGMTDSCSGNRNRATAYEPGSGSTIMAYSGICGGENTSIFSNASFHAGSIVEIINYTRLDDGSSCSLAIAGQLAPTVNAGQDFTIPGGTAFTLSGSSTGSNSTYQWDQMDTGTATNATTHGSDNGSNALFRSYAPVASAERTLPTLATLLGTNSDPLAAKAETLPTENRTLNFRLTARNGSGGVGEDDMQVVVDGNAGPFELLQPTTNVVLDSGLPQSIQWNAACTNAAPVNCASVDILLTTDNGQTYTALASSVPNSGIASVTLPSINTTTARIKLMCSDNIFFDISNVDFEINNSTGGSLPETLIGGSYNCGTAKIVEDKPSSGGVLSEYYLLVLLTVSLFRLARKK